MARSPMQRSVFIGGGRVVVRAYGITGTKALSFQWCFSREETVPTRKGVLARHSE
jgi:hypothetical protein